MISFITVEALLPLRNEVLREGKLTPDECRFPGDEAEGAFHVGFFKDGVLVSVASFHPQGYNGYSGKGYQLRGMATKDGYRGLGSGSLLIDFAVDVLIKNQVDYLWCNARKSALGFYLQKHFQIISEEFEVKSIGPHYAMVLKLA
jgi:GNAT superfamily N-acetyltransferase